MHASKFFKGTIIGIAVLAGSINLARAQADYTNTAWTGFFWTNATQWADGYSDGYYPGAQAAGGCMKRPSLPTAARWLGSMRTIR